MLAMCDFHNSFISRNFKEIYSFIFLDHHICVIQHIEIQCCAKKNKKTKNYQNIYIL